MINLKSNKRQRNDDGGKHNNLEELNKHSNNSLEMFLNVSNIMSLQCVNPYYSNDRGYK